MLPDFSSIRVIGQGAGTTIHQIQHLGTQKFYALKCARRAHDPEGKIFQQIETEHRTGRKTSHPNVRQTVELIRVRRFFRTVELQLLLEYLEGQTLDRLSGLELSSLVNVFAEVARGLHAMHQAGFVHSDIKPINVMVLTDHHVKIIDLGQSCPIGAVKKRIQGTPDFIAPEQVLKMPLDERTDVFNLGATMYWCLTGRAYPTRLQSKHSLHAFPINDRKDIPCPIDLNPAVPVVLSNLVMDCCRNNPKNRLATMSLVLTALEAVSRIGDKFRAREKSPTVDSIPDVLKPRKVDAQSTH